MCVPDLIVFDLNLENKSTSKILLAGLQSLTFWIDFGTKMDLFEVRILLRNWSETRATQQYTGYFNMDSIMDVFINLIKTLFVYTTNLPSKRNWEDDLEQSKSI